MSIIAVPSMGEGGLNDKISPRFGRCASFTFIEIENKEIKAVKAVPNPAANAMGGAGVQAAQIIGSNNTDAIIVGFLGPNAAEGLKALNLKIYQSPNQPMTIKEVMNLYLKGKLEIITSSNVGSHYGMGGGRRGMGGRGQEFGRRDQP